ncbi:MAG: D-alanyl-D-alanine carboxypeptidase family protein [Eubacterium ramulus]|uniref:D-alanyl-D-alanine carboxypeptidase family protein n=1 Tax=Clostridia TaxID=186801 RepID=UPI001314C34B|nr:MULTISPECIES: D-alanyl-D-alanine carboxypeptidase family protein [Clostridia]
MRIFLTAIFICAIFTENGYAATRFPTEEISQNFADFHREDLNLYAKSAVLTDADTGRILYGKDAGTPMANASTTKIMTCLLAIESGKIQDTVTFSEHACSMPKVRLGCPTGTQFVLEDLLYSLMLESHNDTAAAIAEHVAGSVEAFADLMNERAAEFGCQNTHFVTPNGLDRSDKKGEHQTTAYDLSLIMAACIQNDKFLEITETASKTISSIDGTFQAALNNHNALLSMLDGVISGKTGFTAKAGYCYVGAYRQNDRTYTFALLACGWPNHKNYKWEDSKALISYGNDHYENRTILKEEEHQTIDLNRTMVKTFGKNHYYFTNTLSVTKEACAFQILVSENDEITMNPQGQKELSFPVTEGDVVATEEILWNGLPVQTRRILADETLFASDYPWCLWEILLKWKF